MKTPLRMLSLVLALGTASTVAHAQGGGGMRMTAEERKAKMFEGITLTAEQKIKIDTIMAQMAKKQAEMMAASAGSPPSPEMRTKRMEMQAEQAKSIKGVLTADQNTTFDKNMEAMAPRRPGN